MYYLNVLTRHIFREFGTTFLHKNNHFVALFWCKVNIRTIFLNIIIVKKHRHFQRH